MCGRHSCKREAGPAVRGTDRTAHKKVGEQERTRIGLTFHQRQKTQEKRILRRTCAEFVPKSHEETRNARNKRFAARQAVGEEMP